MSQLKPVPDGYHTVTPWILGQDTAGLIDFLTTVFDAVDLGRMTDEEGRIGHAEVRIGDSVVLMFDVPDWPPTPAFLRLYVSDVQAVHDRAVAGGGTSVTEPTHVFWGDRIARVTDPYGNLYWLMQRIEEVDDAEATRRLSDPEFRKNLEYVQGTLYFPPTRP
ncbi:VOC family protein [Microlunatus parietis]|uniref:Putative glyoxalase superfamily protein PhnB n=1 Tax=Microlunatus parietis TaxID=682979 RepID=A0A7Y9IEM5_9ACTN|nr:VOC family protein [Microlunatus parietis]NYE74809.1 putative glyoxalase superfamily protein PhnB [Microlunatus parietis]